MKTYRILLFMGLLAASVCSYATETILTIPFGSTSVVLPPITLLSIDTTPEGAIAETGITSSESGLEIDIVGNAMDDGDWHASHVTATINAIGGTCGQFEVPDSNDVHFEECPASSGAYHLILPDSYYAIDDGTTDCSGSACNSTSITIRIRDSSSPTFADKWVRVVLNVTDTDTLVDLIWDEPAAGHATAGTSGDALFVDVPDTNTVVNGPLQSQLSAAILAASRNFVYQATIDFITSQTAFQVDAGDDPGADNFHTNKWLCVEDADSEFAQDCARIASFTSSTDEWVIDNALDFTVQVGDEIFIRAPSNMEPVLAGLVLLSGTTDSGSTTSFVDAALTQSDSDYWAKNAAVVFTSGSVSGQTFCVIGFITGTDTINFTPPATQSIGTDDYTLIAAPGCDPFR